ncbi:hypothetical protein RhiXN_04753 [Rhizoctonia solani]|uniref:Uncharacterized protein n=1 Tax=Rhizoctonia solani TaxID=456999 RepID=A0A8H8SSF5_9AGAM|nr:uncharacterized protein RhiXN_04753 [Rhizoctonia solani]QRW16751.1 hypothetical protein RhiXN_04753 [Rhizoctonia solani]
MAPQDPKLAVSELRNSDKYDRTKLVNSNVESRGLVAYHALWILDSVKLGRTLPMEQYQIDGEAATARTRHSPPEPETTISAPRVGSFKSSHYTHSGSSLREMSLDYSYAGDLSINQDVDLDGLLHSPSRLSDFRTDCNSSSVLSWDMASSFGFGFDDDEEEQSRVETRLMLKIPASRRTFRDWSK